MTTPTSNQIPKCRLCGKNHFARENCFGQLHGATNTSREGRRVLKGSTVGEDTAKPTRSASTEKANPHRPAPVRANAGTGETPAGGTAKPRQKGRAKK